jgi:polyisoprenoid-binding protein YceI
LTRFTISPTRSHVWIHARSNVHPIHSDTVGVDGYVELTLDPDGSVDLSGTAPSGRISLAVDRLRSGNRMEDRELQRRIDARRYPFIEGSLETFSHDKSDGSYRIGGDVTFRGVTRRHEDLMQIRRIDERTILLTGSSRFDIREYGMQPPRILVLRVEPEVEVRVELYAVQEGDARQSS